MANYLMGKEEVKIFLKVHPRGVQESGNIKDKNQS